MSGTFDTSVVRTEEIGSLWLTFDGRSLSKQRYAVRQIGHMWQFAITTKPMVREEWQKLNAFHNQQRGKFGNFSYTSKAMSTPLGAISGSTYNPSVNGSTHAGGGTTVAVENLPPSSIVWLAGDFIKFNNHAKVYAIESTSITSNGSGEATLTIYPELVSALSSGETLSFENVAFTMNFADDFPKMPVGVNGLAEFEFTLEEDF